MHFTAQNSYFLKTLGFPSGNKNVILSGRHTYIIPKPKMAAFHNEGRMLNKGIC